MTVFPGTTITERSYERWAEQAAQEGISAEEVETRQREATLLKRHIYAEDVANLVAFLCSPLAVSLTGEAIAANGGESVEIHK
jgi:enoyl-[acyl-carrier-protein] reductase (NADH)